jgi:hypothetical protein
MLYPIELWLHDNSSVSPTPSVRVVAGGIEQKTTSKTVIQCSTRAAPDAPAGARFTVRWRSQRDSNPWYPSGVHTISNRAPSATRSWLLRRNRDVKRTNGGGGIRTPGSSRFGGFQNRCLRPLGHASMVKADGFYQASSHCQAPPSRSMTPSQARPRFSAITAAIGAVSSSTEGQGAR